MTRNQYDPAFANMKDDFDTHTKQCRKCLEVKPFDAFSHCKGGRFGLQAYCKPCAARQKKPYRHAVVVRRIYGLSEDVYNLLLDYQGGKCAICRKEQPQYGRIKNLAVDHDKRTNKIRGLLCMRCNRALGLIGHDPELLRTAARYLEKA